MPPSPDPASRATEADSEPRATDVDPAAVEAAAALIRDADALLVCAGAGMGVDSGLPDFRGPDGFWGAYPPYRALGLRFEEMADPVHFEADPALAWGFYGHRLARYRETVPHVGFDVLRRWSDTRDTWVFTSNVDGQFQRAGFADDRVAEVHGSIHHTQCLLPCRQDVWPADDIDVPVDESTMRAVGELPACRHCGTLARPNILMFGDYDWVPARSQATLDGLTAWRRAQRGARLAVVEVGAGSALPTVRRYAELASTTTGALVRINPREPHVRHGRGVSIAAGAAPALTAIDDALRGS